MPVIKCSDIKFKINYEFTIVETPVFHCCKAFSEQGKISTSANNLTYLKFNFKSKKNRYFRYFDISETQISKYRYLKNTAIYRYIDISQQPNLNSHIPYVHKV